MPEPFLTAEWRYLAMLNFEVDPLVLRPLVPAGTELDDWRGRTFVSVVGFRFLDTRMLGMAIPFHCNFEEINLRFYVRRQTSEGWRRAVVFVKELVPRAAIALAARVFYGENYIALPMRHEIQFDNDGGQKVRRVVYSWKFKGRENRIEMNVQGKSRDVETASQEEFITEHYWGYTRRRDGSTLEYQVEHPRWQVWTAESALLDCNTAQLYGIQFAEFLRETPASALLAEGSRVTVFKGIPLILGRSAR
ncbi:MAG: YqjF family protein [Candidatus Binatia bacterium]